MRISLATALDQLSPPGVCYNTAHPEPRRRWSRTFNIRYNTKVKPFYPERQKLGTPMMRALCLAVALLLGPGLLMAKEKQPATYEIVLPPKPDFSPLDWMVGEWTGKMTGNGPQGEVHFSAAYDLNQRLLILREEVSMAATKTVPALKENFLGVLSGEPSSGYVLRWFSTTGFITRYRLSVNGPEISLNQEGGDNPPPGWLFRRLIRHPDPSQFIETVQVAPTNRPFFDYYTAKLTRVLPPKVSTAIPGH